MLTGPGKVILLGSCLIGLAAVLWPTANQKPAVDVESSGVLSSCPLGFTSGEKPPQHPTVQATDHGRKVDAAGRKPPDERYHLFFNATIWKGLEQEKGQAGAFAEALLVHRGGVVAVGSLEQVRRAAEEAAAGQRQRQRARQPAVEAALPSETEEAEGAEALMVVDHDLGGRFVVPGFVDAHVHLVPAGLALGRVDLRGAASRAEFLERVAAAAGRAGREDWLLGGQWDEGRWGGELPSAAWLDEVCGGRPAYLTRHDLHLALANTAALERAGVGSDTPDPPGGIIDRDPATGRPTGLLREGAMTLMEGVIPEPSPAERAAAVAAAFRLALSRGVTTLVDMGRFLSGDPAAPWRDLEQVYLPAAEEGRLPVRLLTHVPLRTWRRLASLVAARGRAHPGGRLFWGALKEFADGSLGSHTALLWAPYSDTLESDATGSGGGGRFGQRAVGYEELRELAEAAVGAGLQVSIHAIGDRAVDEVAAAYRAALEKAAGGAVEAGGGGAGAGGGGAGAGGGGAGAAALAEWVRRRGEELRLRIEHTQHLSCSDNTTRALVAAGLTPVPNPLHLLTDAAMLLPRLGTDRAPRSFALASLVRAGLRPALASDWPVVDLQPLTGLYAAVHRHLPPPEVMCAMRRSLPAAAEATQLEVVGASNHGGGTAAACGMGTGGAGGEAGEGEGKGVGEGKEEEEEEGCVSEGELASWPEGFTPAEALSVEEALLGHTVWGARAAGLEDYVGSLQPGRRADFVELSASLLGEGGGGGGKGGRRLSKERLRRCLPAVLRTWVDGELVYDATGAGLAGEGPSGEDPSSVAVA